MNCVHGVRADKDCAYCTNGTEPKRDRPHILLGSTALPVANKQEEEKKLVDALGPREVDGVFKMPLSPDDISMRGYGSEEHFERTQKAVARALLDVDKDHRLKSGMCRTCYYLRVGVVATQSFTRKPCKRWGCKEETRWHNGDTPQFCEYCAKGFGICRRCGGDLEFQRRKSMKPPKRR